MEYILSSAANHFFQISTVLIFQLLALYSGLNALLFAALNVVAPANKKKKSVLTFLGGPQRIFSVLVAEKRSVFVDFLLL